MIKNGPLVSEEFDMSCCNGSPIDIAGGKSASPLGFTPLSVVDLTASAGSNIDTAVPVGSKYCRVRAVGGGGGGGGKGAFYDKGGGGGAGEYGEGYILDLDSDLVTHIRTNLGAGGAKASATNVSGSSGGDTTISKIIAATPTLLATFKGGSGGKQGGDGRGGAGGTGGSSLSNGFLVDGHRGFSGRNQGAAINSLYFLGYGANSELGNGGSSGTDSLDNPGVGDVATDGKYGGGGAGGIWDLLLFDPSAGGDGRVILEFWGNA